MKKTILSVLGIGVLFVAAWSLLSCGGDTKNGSVKDEEKSENPSLNISIFLDLSDRLVRNMQPNQTYRDTAIVGMACDYFKTATLGPQILKSENKIKVFFYPTPSCASIATVAKGLSVDVGALKGVERRKAVEGLKTQFQENLAHIYGQTVNAKNWIGCDIWDFFSSKKVDAQCVKKDARNILIILTDGYIYQANNKIKEGNAFSFILPETLQNPQSSLIARRTDVPLDNLEVLVLEVNPYQPQHRDKMVQVMTDWFQAMGVKNVVISETDANLDNTETIIKNFLN